MPLPPRRVLRTFKYAVYFDEVNAYVQVPYISVFNQQAFTVMGWISQLNVKQDNVLFTTCDSFANDRCLHLVIRNGYPYLGFWADDLHGRRYLGTNMFYHLTFIWEGLATKLQKIYVDAVLDNRRVSSGLLTVTSGSVTGNGGWIGRAWDRYHCGFIFQVLIYSRALSDSEIQYNYQYPDNPVRNGLVLWLQADPQYIKDIDGDGRLEWIDLSGYNNHGKIYGAQLVQLPIKTPSRVLKPVRILKPVR